jgi:hypothetical protein
MNIHQPSAISEERHVLIDNAVEYQPKCVDECHCVGDLALAGKTHGAQNTEPDSYIIGLPPVDGGNVDRKRRRAVVTLKDDDRILVVCEDLVDCLHQSLIAST